MFRHWIGAIAVAVATIAAVPAVAQADGPSSSITSWTSSEPGTPPNAPYLISYDNPPSPAVPTTLTVQGQATGIAAVDIVCYYGSGSTFGDAVLASNVSVTSGTFFKIATLRPIAGHACRLRAIPAGGEPGDDLPQYAGPQVAVSEVALPSGAVDNNPYDFYVAAITFAGSAAWDSAGSCGPYSAPFDSSFGQGNFAIDCAGSLLDANLLTGATRSEVQVDGQNAYDAASAHALFGGSEFPSLGATVEQDPTDGAVASQSTEGWEVCSQPVVYAAACPSFVSAGVQLARNITTSDGGLVTTMTDTWSSTDGQAHSLDLLYDDYVGLKTSNAQRGYEFPGQHTFSAYIAGATVPGPSTSPGSILVRTNVAEPDPYPGEADGAITFSTPPTGYTFISNSEFEEHQTLQVPAGGSASLTYIYSTDYTVAQVEALAQAAEDTLQAPAIAITSPATGSTVSTSTVDVSGTATAGSGISSLSVAGQPVPVEPGGAWRAEVPLSPGSNTISALGTDAAGATVQSQITVVYQPPSGAPSSPPPQVLVCKVPQLKGMKLPAAERALRLAHCQVGRIKHERSNKVRKDRILVTNPKAGQVFAAGHRIELFLSKGP